MQSTKILVGVCTYQRPQMLKNCLQYIAAMEMDADQEVVCFVVNNDSEPIPSEIVETFSASSSGVTFKFADCKERGIHKHAMSFSNMRTNLTLISAHSSMTTNTQQKIGSKS